MGAWGCGLYANDTTCDVRDIYMGFLQAQLSNEEAYETILTQCHEYLDDPDEAPLFWFALADTQWKVGRLLPEVKANALDWIDKNGGMALWEESTSGGAGWQKTLDKLRVKLQSEQPKEKRVRKPVQVESNLWNDGDVYAYLFQDEWYQKDLYGRADALGKYMVMHKIGVESRTWGDSGITQDYMIVRVFDRLFDELPTLDDLHGLRLLPLDFLHSWDRNTTKELLMSEGITLERKKDYPTQHLTHLGNIPVPTYAPPAKRRNMLGSWNHWDSINTWSGFFARWQGVEYDIGADGVYRYTHAE